MDRTGCVATCSNVQIFAQAMTSTASSRSSAMISTYLRATADIRESHIGRRHFAARHRQRSASATYPQRFPQQIRRVSLSKSGAHKSLCNRRQYLIRKSESGSELSPWLHLFLGSTTTCAPAKSAAGFPQTSGDCTFVLDKEIPAAEFDVSPPAESRPSPASTPRRSSRRRWRARGRGPCPACCRA